MGKVNLLNEESTNLPQQSMKMAMTCITTGPILLLYPFVQKYFVKRFDNRCCKRLIEISTNMCCKISAGNFLAEIFCCKGRIIGCLGKNHVFNCNGS